MVYLCVASPRKDKPVGGKTHCVIETTGHLDHAAAAQEVGRDGRRTGHNRRRDGPGRRGKGRGQGRKPGVAALLAPFSCRQFRRSRELSVGLQKKGA